MRYSRKALRLGAIVGYCASACLAIYSILLTRAALSPNHCEAGDLLLGVFAFIFLAASLVLFFFANYAFRRSKNSKLELGK